MASQIFYIQLINGKSKFPIYVINSIKEYIDIANAYGINDKELKYLGIKNGILSIGYNGNEYMYSNDIAWLIKENKLTNRIIKMYEYLLDNTEISAFCHNVECEDYGPQSWSEFKQEIAK